MGVPRLFATEYIERSADLLKHLERVARERNLLSSFAIMAAMTVILIPLERTAANHPARRREFENGLRDWRSALEEAKFVGAHDFVAPPGDGWILSNVDPRTINAPSSWRNMEGHRPLSAQATNRRCDVSAIDVIYIMRHALAHGNIYYLDENGDDHPGKPVKYIAFLSKENDGDRRLKYWNLLITTDKMMMEFLGLWITWLKEHDARRYSLKQNYA